MSVSTVRNLICWVMVLVFPSGLQAADTGSAILRSNGGVWVNGTEVAASTAIFAGDFIETRPGSVANLDAEGSSVLIQAESVVKFEGDHLVLEHGSVAVGTSTSMSVHVNCIKVIPVSVERTQYDVKDVSGAVEVVAHKSDVNITQGGATRKASSENVSSSSATVHEGQQAKRDESSACGAASRPGGASTTPNTKLIVIAGAGGGAVVLCLLLCKGTQPPHISPKAP